MTITDIFIILLLLVILYTLFHSVFIVFKPVPKPVPVPVPVPVPTQHLIGGCAGTRYGCCPNGVTAKLNAIGSNC
jgi:hypothetical protein